MKYTLVSTPITFKVTLWLLVEMNDWYSKDLSQGKKFVFGISGNIDAQEIHIYR